MLEMSVHHQGALVRSVVVITAVVTIQVTQSLYKSEKRKLITSNWSCHQIRDTDLVSEKLGRILSPLFQCELEIFPTNFPPNKDRADQ